MEGFQREADGSGGAEGMSMDYSAAIKALREKLLITQTELGEMLGVTFQTVNRWEKGHHKPAMKQKRRIRDLCMKNGIEMD